MSPVEQNAYKLEQEGDAVLTNGLNHQDLENSSALRSSLKDSRNDQFNLETRLPNGEAGRRREIRTRRTTSLIVSAPDGVYLRNPSRNSNSSTAELIVLAVEEGGVTLNESQSKLSNSSS